MNIALSTLILFFLLIPGIAFRRFYYSEEFSGEYFKETFFAVFISTILPSLFFHFVWYFFANLCSYSVDLYVLSNIVSKQPSELSFTNIQNNACNIVVYNLTMFLAAGFGGYFIKKIVRSCKWDRKYKFFRFQNSWHYILKGEFFDFPRAEMTLEKDSVEDIEFVFVDAVLEMGGESYLYDGILVDYELSNDGGLETISLTNSKRRQLKGDSEIINNGDERANSLKYYSIGGHVLVLKYHELKNLNFTYYILDLNEEDNEYYPRIVE